MATKRISLDETFIFSRASLRGRCRAVSVSVTSCVYDHYTATLSVSIYIRSSSSTAAATHNIFVVVVFVFVSVVTIDDERIGDSSLIIVTESKERRRAR